MKRAQVIIQNLQLLDAGGTFFGAFTAPQNVVEITAPENFKVTRVTFQHFTYTQLVEPVVNLNPFVSISTSPPVAPGDGYILFARYTTDAVTGNSTSFLPESHISFETFTEHPLQGNFYVAACGSPVFGVLYLTVVWEGYYDE